MRWTTVSFWILFALLVLYIILKGVGVIQSPEWVELSPFAMVALLFLIIRGDIRKDIETAIESTILPLKDSLNEINKSINKINNRVSKQEGTIETILHLSRKRKI